MVNLYSMKTKGFLLLSLFSSVLMTTTSCSDGKQQEIEKLNKQVDSLLQDNTRKDCDIKEMMSFVGIMADGLDSIALREDMLLYTNKGKEGTIIDRAQLKKNLEMFEKTLEEQKLRISQLADSLRAKGNRLERLTSLVNYLNKQLEEKENLIKSLRADINNKNVNISNLKNKVNSLADNNAKLVEKVENQVQALATQSEMINEGYVIIDTKKSLSDLGIISGGLLKKTKVNFDAIQKSQFRKVDIRKFTEITINSSKPKILTQMPTSSYRIERTGSTSTLYILDPTLFWSVSNYLIIQKK